ncbi:hydrocephalus-inducing protein homolog [Cheilinus undulatus]|uniref:hydrocephalus-inducing protein homolog n=1 Tax=Cheilinus undulatus TaxID=241271 RepID=UPI001BD56122|nr:hydrocephalus-inducing protein homolog [Cheilinus undulatus]
MKHNVSTVELWCTTGQPENSLLRGRCVGYRSNDQQTKWTSLTTRLHEVTPSGLSNLNLKHAVDFIQTGSKMTTVQVPPRKKRLKSLPCNLKFTVKEEAPRRVTPSVYTQEMLRSTEECQHNTKEVQPPRILELFDMSKTTHHKMSSVGMDQPLFQPFPSKLVFQNFTPAQTYKLPLVLINNDKVPRKVKVELQGSEYFHVVGPEDARRSVAPGLSATFTVLFTPQENKDYCHNLVCVTEREQFEVPIHAIGPRAILDFRDEFHLPICPVKTSTQRTHFVRNIGNSEAKFTLHTQRPFTVTPSSGTLEVGQGMLVTVDFNPVAVGEYSQDLILHYHTGEDVHIALYGVCEEVNIQLVPDFVLLPKAYISLASLYTVSLINRSDIPVKYCWTAWPSLQEEALSLLRDNSVLKLKEEKTEQLLYLCESDPTAIHRLPLLSTALQEYRSQAVKDHLLALSHSCITVEPAEGEIWPNMTAEFRIVFKPDEAKLYQQTIYCDVAGRESRLPLTIKGEGLGPELQLRYNLMDMKNIYIGDRESYEVHMSNTGLIDAAFHISCPDTTFGCCFSFNPEEGVVPTGANQIVTVTFHSQILGSFSEDLLLTVKGQPQPLTLTFRGSVIGPTFHFDISEFNFGDVAFGFPKTLTCTLFNTSYVPMTFALRVLGDGSGSPSVTYLSWINSTMRDVRAHPVEFTISPAAGSVRAFSDVTIKLELCSNTVKRYRLALVVDVEGVGEEIMTLPINARCVVPNILVETPVLDFQRCFLDSLSIQQVRLTNTSSLPACVAVLDQDYENRSMLFGCSCSRGSVCPNSSVELPVYMLARAVGRLHHTLRIMVFGSILPPLEVPLSCFGQGPIVQVNSRQLDFGKIPVLRDITRTLKLSNQSPIPAHFTAKVYHKKPFWRVEPSEGEVPPESQLEVNVVAHLRDTLDFQARLDVSIKDGQTHSIPLSATGTGTTIVSDRPFAPSLDLGTFLSHETCQYHFKLTNHGQRVHRLYWSRQDFLPPTKTCKRGSLSGHTILPPISSPKERNSPDRVSFPSREQPMSSLRPTRVELFPDSTVDMVLTVSSNSPKVVRERLVCHGIVGNQGCNQHIMTVDVTCRFVAPVLSFSSKKLNFYMEKVPGKNLTPLYEKLILRNASSLSLTVELSLVEPFSLCDAQRAYSSLTTKSIVLGDRGQAELWICFNPADYQDRVSRVVDQFLEVNYQGHPQQDIVELHAEVHFPNLHFPLNTVDFGCVLNSTLTKKVISITNCSPLPVYYQWDFLEDKKQCTISPSAGADEQQSTHRTPRVEEAFDVIPVYGNLQPGDEQPVTFSFYGLKNVSRELTARCRVEEGPTYEITLRGEASVISYSLDSSHVDFGPLLFDHVGEAEVTLKNTGKIGFKFLIIDLQSGDNEEAEGKKKNSEEAEQPPNAQQRKSHGEIKKGEEIRPGQPMVIPSMGYIDANAELCLRVLYLPGVPEVFEKRLQLQVAYLPPQGITLTGEGLFPRISLDLPQNISEEYYSDLMQQARAAVEACRTKEEFRNGNTTKRVEATTESPGTPTNEELLHMEIEKALVKQNALSVTALLLELSDSQGSREWQKLSKLTLPEYILDFGFVVPGKVLSHTVKITNTGSVAVSFHANLKCLAGTGFSADFERVKDLPCRERHSFTVKFDPQGANLEMGDKNVVMPIQVTGGPSIQVRLCAVMTVPSIAASADSLQFDTLQCGMCQMKTIHLFNNEPVPCHWSIAEEVKPFKKVDKFLPLYQRKKVLQGQRPPPVVFETIPSSGMLAPGERVSVQIKFSPVEENVYNRQLVVQVAESKQKVFIKASGKAEDLQLEFCPSVLELEPCLPFSTEAEAEVTVRNPCSFPIEFYSLDFDTQYLEEEKILRLMQGYDENNILLLPPRAPGESLPTELLDYYEEYCSQLKDDAVLEENVDESMTWIDESHENETMSEQKCAHQSDTTKPAELFISEMNREGSSGRLGQLEMTPVSRAIARHMCIDLSPEGLAARNRRGIAIIVYGAPLIGKSKTAAALAQHYGGTSLSVDAVVTDALMNSVSPASMNARQLYDCAAAKYAEKKAEEPETTDLKPATHLEAFDPSPNSGSASNDAVKVFKKPSEDDSNLSNNPHETAISKLALCLGGDKGALSSLLPEQLLVDVLAERFQLRDCYRGIVIDGLNSVYTQSAASTVQVVLKALDNRKHIYVVNLCDSYKRAQRETEETTQREKRDREEQWLKELDEEEYDALPEEEKKRIDLQFKEKFREPKQRELKQREKEKEEKRLLEEMRLKEEELTKKNKKCGKKDTQEMSRKRSLLEGRRSTDAPNGGRMSSCHNSKESLIDLREQHISNESERNTHHSNEVKKQKEGAKELHAESPQLTDKLEKEKSCVDEQQSLFSLYEQSQEQVEYILQHWDRAQGLLQVPPDDTVPERRTPAGKSDRKGDSKVLPPMPSQIAVPTEVDKTGDNESPPDSIPHIVLNVTGEDHPIVTELLKGSTLPPLVEVLDDLGLGPSGPPIPPPTTFSIVPFPKHRKQPSSDLTCDCFTFLEEQSEEEDDSQVPTLKVMELTVHKEKTTAASSKTHDRANLKESQVTKEKEKKGRESQRSKRRSSAKVKGENIRSTSSRSNSTAQDQHQVNLELKRSKGLKIFRWVVPANGTVVLKIWFYSESPGKYEQIFNFELSGTQRNYQLVCSGICTYPTICREYKTLFAHSKKVQQMEEGLQKAYVIQPGYFEFGPLLCGKTRDRYKEKQYPENMERILICNSSGMQAEVQFSFQHDTQATTYLLDPPTMTLKPEQKQELTVWAYPTKVGQINDSLVCHIKDNPEPVIINLSCWGVRPELKLEPKHLHFDKTLPHRLDSRCLKMHNKTALPVSWKLQGMKELGDEFTVPHDQGVISPNSSFCLSMHFRARKPVMINKILCVEVSDVEKIVGVLQTENIQVSAEAYNIALDISPDGCLNFGTIKVFEEAMLFLKLKNKGKYEIAYKFSFQQTDPAQPNLDSAFRISPQSGTLMPHDKQTEVQITCRPATEVSLKEQPVLLCEVIEPNIRKGGETITILAIKVSVQALFSRYKITPAHDMNFGPLVYGCRQSQNFTIENTGVFETRFTISCTTMDPAAIGRSGGHGKKVLQESLSGGPAGADNRNMAPRQNRLSMGLFTVSPYTGNLQPGSQQVVTVECPAVQLGIWNQLLYIDISDRDPSDQPEGIQYSLMAEVCKPGIALDTTSIFEEHHLCTNSSQLSSEQFCNADGIYVRDENKFIFHKVLVGRTAKARFKLTNNGKVPCVLNLAIQYAGTRPTMKVFDLCATALSIPSQSHSFAEVTFTPLTVHLYSAVFEATISGASNSSRQTPKFKSKVLEFDLMGEGNLPSVCVVRPALKNSQGNPMLHFRRVLIGRRRTMPLVLLNDGNVPAQIQIDILDKHRVFTLRTAPGNTINTIHSTLLEDSTHSDHQLVHKANLRLNVNERAEFDVSFCSDKTLSVRAKMSLQVNDNQYSMTTIELTAESYQETVSLDIIRSLQEKDQEEEEGGYYERLNFGDCHVDCSLQESFTMTNHSNSKVVRFEWPPAGPHVFFSPQVGHLHAGCSKEVTVTFGSSQPVTLTSEIMTCRLCQVEFQQPLEQVADWDDRQRTVNWLSSTRQSVRNKVTMTDPEPCCTVVEGSQWEMELRISAVCDYVKFSCKNEAIHFKDTMLYQTRIQQLQMVNQGTVKLDYIWEVLIDPRNTVSYDQEGGSLTSRPGSRSGEVSSGARPSSTLGRVMSLMMGNPELPPFSIEPRAGTIQPGDAENFNICFSPLEVAQFQGRLNCSIPNLQDNDQAPSILVCGRSLFPHYHFDLEDSDYVSCRNSDLRPHLDPNIRVIELNAVGFSAPTTRCFSVMNPTSKPYTFKWRCEDTGDCLFRCLTPCGTILPGKKVEVCFEYVAQQMDVVESFWSFVIETLSLSIPFLCVGNAREPNVYLDRPHLDFGEVLVGRKAEQAVHLVNGEEEPFHFSVVPSSLICDDQESTLILQPMSGTLAPKDRLTLSVSFMPRQEGCVSFRLVLRTKRKSEPLRLVVKASSFTISFQAEKQDGGIRVMRPDHQDCLDFGMVEIFEQSTINLKVSHPAKFNLELKFDITGPSELLQYLEAKPQNAIIECGNQLQSSLFFCPRSICNLKDARLSVKVKHGPVYTFAIKGSAVASSLHFSFTKYNFGKCFLYCPGTEPASQTLKISNRDERDVSVQCKFKNTSYMEVDCKPDVLSPGAMLEVPVRFYPREACGYHEKLHFILNSGVTKKVDIMGRGVERKLEVEDPKQRTVKLGSLMIGQKVKKRVALVNHSVLDLSFTLLLSTSIPFDQKDLSFSPAGELTLKARGGSCNVEIQFSPHQHIPPFSAELQAEFPGLLHPLLTIQGCCKGVEVKLDQVHLAFGVVVQGCQAKKKIVMMNTGDIGAKFQWKTEHFPAELSITPAKGYISPDKDIPFEVTFSPVELSDDTRYENVSCCVEGLSSPVTLTVTGSCMVASTGKEVVNFVCPVRNSHTQTLPVTNPTSQHCSIRPVIEGEQWSAEPSVNLEPFQNMMYKITYKPLTMTPDKKKHMGSVFFSFPDGSGMLYSLQGTSEPPKAEDIIQHELPAKTLHTQMLPVHNWLSKQQRFHVLMEILKPDKTDETVSLKGVDYIHVPPLAKRDYKMSFFSYRQGQFTIKVTFSNMTTGEYLFYLVTFKVTSPGVLSTIQMEAAVRRTVSATVEVENPLTTATCLSIECNCPEISVPTQHTVPGQSKSSLSFEYRPLRADELTARLTLSNDDLGDFHYELVLRALPPPPEKTIHFNTSLGSSHSVLVKFINYSYFKTKYSCKTDCPDFTVDRTVDASPGAQAGSEASVEVSFEPYKLGEVRGQLILCSGIGGEYVFPLHGACHPPKPQGPFSIRAGHETTIPFKNVFLQTTAFSFQVDNPCFIVKGVDTIPSKRIYNIPVSLDVTSESSAGPWFGRLTVSSQRSEGHRQPCSWVYYLKGYRPGSS